ncbi:hypothetical protein SDC9_150828 [bioreactor metagenome]|uniref:Uncharacterized protein n=1 Tax=bioreactor metagenome TaxID=1076179 RepID=A0A645EP63_9ZZZZ
MVADRPEQRPQQGDDNRHKAGSIAPVSGRIRQGDAGALRDVFEIDWNNRGYHEYKRRIAYVVEHPAFFQLRQLHDGLLIQNSFETDPRGVH